MLDKYSLVVVLWCCLFSASAQSGNSSNGVIPSIILLKADYLKQQGAVITKSTDIFDKSISNDSLSLKYSQVYITNKTISIGNLKVKAKSEFVFYSGKLSVAKIFFAKSQTALIKTELNKKYGAETPDYWSDISNVFIFYDSVVHDSSIAKLEFGNTNVQDKLNSFIGDLLNKAIDQEEIVEKTKNNSPTIPFARRTAFSDVFALHQNGLLGSEIKLREIYISSTPKIVPKGVIWRIIKISNGNNSSNRAGIYLEGDNVIPVNYFDLRYDLGENDTSSCFVFNTLNNMSISGAFKNIDMGSFPISTMPLDFVSGYMIKTASKSIQMLVYEYKFSKKQVEFLENN